MHDPGRGTATPTTYGEPSQGRFTDSGGDDNPWAITVSWGDGTPTESYASPGNPVSGESRLVYRTHRYTTAGVYTVTVTVTDSDAGTATRSFTITVP